MVASNREQRRAAAKSAGVSGQVFSQLVVIDDLGTEPHTVIAAAVVAGLGSLVEQGAAPLERCAITLGRDHPAHVGKMVLEVKTDRRSISSVTPITSLGEPLTLGKLKAAAESLREPKAAE